MRLTTNISTLLVAGLLVGIQSAAGSYSVGGLKCEYAVDPLGVDVAAPRLFWMVQSDERNQRQTAWQVLAASTMARLEPGRTDLWDSGKIATSQTTQVPYGGKPLASSERVFWRVRSWDAHGQPSAWSEPATWTMGRLSPDDWTGEWIRAAEESESELLRREFSAGPNLHRAVLHLSGLGQYRLFINGTRVGKDLLSPGWTNYRKTALYDTFDVTDHLHPGINVIGVHLGNGMFQVDRRDRYSKFEGSFGPKRLIADLVLEYTDGGTQIFGSDGNWTTHSGPITFSNIYGGEDYDARLLPEGWSEPDFDAASWNRAVKVEGYGKDILRGMSVAANPLRVIEVRQPVEVRQLAAPGGVLYDFGQNTSYMPRLRISGPRGSRVVLTPGELIYPDGYITRSSMGGVHRGFSWMTYTKGSDEVETWTPAFFYIGSRYFQTQTFAPEGGGPLPVIELLEGLVVHSNAEPIGDFRTANPLMDQIRELVRWAQKSNMVSVLTDCPHREKLGWLEQYHLNGPAIRYEFDVNRIFTKGMNDMADSQTGAGLIPNIAPEYTRFNGTFRAAAEWGAAFILVPWQQYLFSGDTDLIRRHYAEMKRYFRYLDGKSSNGLLTEGLGDWYDLGPRGPGRSQLTLPPLTATAFFFYDAKILSRMAAVLGEEGDARQLAARAEAIRQRFNEEFYVPETGSYGQNSQAGNAIPLALGIVDPDQRERVLESLVNDVITRDCTMTAGDIGFRFLLKALSEGGRDDLVYRMINHQRNPGYGYQLVMGATAMTESWDASRTHSNNHFMLGHITEWFYGNLIGIEAVEDAPGFKKMVIHPRPVDGLAWAEGSYKTLHGPVHVRWEQAEGRFLLEVNLPANTSGEVWIPASGVATVTESGKPVDRGREVPATPATGNYVVVEVGSGLYKFEAGN